MDGDLQMKTKKDNNLNILTEIIFQTFFLHITTSAQIAHYPIARDSVDQRRKRNHEPNLHNKDFHYFQSKLIIFLKSGNDKEYNEIFAECVMAVSILSRILINKLVN